MNYRYILENWIVKKRLFWYCSNYSTWKSNCDLYFFGIVLPLFFFLSSFGQYMRLFANHFFGNQQTTLKGSPSNNIHRPTVDSDTGPYEAGCCICHDQQTGMGQTYQICVSAPK